MESRVVFITKRTKAGAVSRDSRVGADFLRFGRSADCEVHLPDPRVMFLQAELHRREAGLYIEAIGDGDVRLKGSVVMTAAVRPGDVIAVGPYDVTIGEPGEGEDAAIQVELVRPFGDDLAQLRARSRTSLGASWLGKRGVSWGLAALVVLLFLVIPVVAYMVPGVREATRDWPIKADTAWSSGEISNPHKFFAEDCAVCHQKAFVPVTDAACTACHKTIQQHADPKQFAMADLRGSGCQSCHKEHEGPRPIVLNNDAFCAQCHANLAALVPKTTLKPAADFGATHPEFQPLVVTELGAAPRRVSLADRPREMAGLAFPHNKHLTPQGVRGPLGMTKLECASCHQAERGGLLMQPVRMEAACSGCHQLKFDPARPDWVLPHGRPNDVARLVRGLYDGLALRGGVEEPNAPAPVRRRPGTPLAEPERLEALAWADRRAGETLRVIFGKSVCGTCHIVDPPAGAMAEWSVRPPRIAQHWLAKSMFRHDRHEVFGCDNCHAATKSESSEDVLIPGIAVCRNCHTGTTPVVNKVSSSCISCHGFHRPELGPMFETAKSGLSTN
ncbi:MAG: hypothetical protein EXQ92_02770 [Alphaproteobacteria bacterium]|nr:hypothetical protein [Alphaproteobacteria bacterium]